MKNHLKTIVFFLSFSFNLAIAECETDCILKNRSQDQDCALENTPLTRCENYSIYLRQDKSLNSEYKNLIRSLTKEEVSALRKTQRSWLDWRLEKCEQIDQQASCDNGVCAGVAHDECIISLTKQRTSELINFKKDLATAKSNNFIFSKKYDY
jgi:uncharacterized protein YecT (DUF1311 family)